MANRDVYEEQNKNEEEVLEKYRSSMKGLHTSDIDKVRERYGRNVLEEPKKKSMIIKFLSKFQNTVAYILIIAIFFSWYLGNIKDAVAITLALFLGATLGFFQEYRSEKALSYLKFMTTQKIRVRRSGKDHIIDSSDLVPGDIIIIEEGMKVPADIRILTCFNIEANESTLTGESLPVEKFSTKSSDNILYAGTITTSG